LKKVDARPRPHATKSRAGERRRGFFVRQSKGAKEWPANANADAEKRRSQRSAFVSWKAYRSRRAYTRMIGTDHRQLAKREVRPRLRAE
jgi:hypothetical protein